MGQSLEPGYDLIITNGDAAGGLIRAAVQGAEVLPWRDVLHEGPVPLTDTHAELSEIRADYLGDCGWGRHEELREAFQARDRGLAHHEIFERVILWFEHDLYDQLQIIQILDWLASNPRDPETLLLLQADDFLGIQSPDALAAMSGREQPVSEAQVGLAVRAWQAFRQPTPERWAGLLDTDLSALPFLGAAVRRALEEMPDPQTGLSRTEWSILDCIAQGASRPPLLFGAVEAREEAAFMGDWAFWQRLDHLAASPEPLVQGLAEAPFAPDRPEEELKAYFQSELSLTPLGEAVRGGEEDFRAIVPPDTWLGGTHITGDALWRWDREAARLVAPH